MSDNKFRYYDVTSVTTVRALNKTDALEVAKGSRKATGAPLAQEIWVERIPAADARAAQESSSQG